MVGATATAPPHPDAAAAPAADLFADATPAADEPLPQGQQVSVGAFDKIDIHVKDLELTKVLQLLSIQSQRNIIASKNVDGQISADLYGVDFYEALDAVLHANGFGYIEKGQFIYVYTQDELAAVEQANRKQVSKIVRLNYLSAADATAFLSPLLSDKGSLSVSGEVGQGFQPSLSNGGANSFAHADTLVIRDYQENVDEIAAVLSELDVRPKQVLVEATILQARLSEANAFGVDFAVFSDLDVGSFTNPLAAVNELIDGSADTGGDTGGSVVSNPGNVATGPATIKIGYLGSDAAVFVRALDSVTDTTVLATPKILVLNRQKADLLVGEKLGYLSTTATETTTTQTVEFLDVGTQLTLRPFVSDDDMVRIEMRPSVSDGSTRLEGGFIIPDSQNQELTTNVIVRSGQTVVLGGLFKEDTSIGRRQVPGLGEVPILGNAFKGQDDSVERSEVIFLVKPTIMKDEKLAAIGDSAERGVRLAGLGAREGLLLWSQSKLTQHAVRDALKAIESGDKDKALWKTNLALYLDPTMVEALQLKEQLTGERVYYHQGSILESAIDASIEDGMKDLGVDLGAAVETEAGAAAVETDGEPLVDEAATAEVSEEPAADALATETAEAGAEDFAGDMIDAALAAEPLPSPGEEAWVDEASVTEAEWTGAASNGPMSVEATDAAEPEVAEASEPEWSAEPAADGVEGALTEVDPYEGR